MMKKAKKSGKMLSVKELRELWPGLPDWKLAQGIDDAISQQEWESDEDDDSVMWDFPSPHWRMKRKDGTLEYKLCEPYSADSNARNLPYSKTTEKYHLRFNFNELYFHTEGVALYENKHPHITSKYAQDELGNALHRAAVAEECLVHEKEKSASLEQSVMQLQEQRASFPSLLAEKEALVQELNIEIAHLKEQPYCTGKGARLTVCSMRRDGKSEQDIVLVLKKQLSTAQIGALMHDNALGVGEEAHKQRVKRALSKNNPNCTTP